MHLYGFALCVVAKNVNMGNMQGASCRQKHRHRNINTSGGVRFVNRPETQEKQPKTTKPSENQGHRLLCEGKGRVKKNGKYKRSGCLDGYTNLYA